MTENEKDVEKNEGMHSEEIQQSQPTAVSEPKEDGVCAGTPVETPRVVEVARMALVLKDEKPTLIIQTSECGAEVNLTLTEYSRILVNWQNLATTAGSVSNGEERLIQGEDTVA